MSPPPPPMSARAAEAAPASMPGKDPPVKQIAVFAMTACAVLCFAGARAEEVRSLAPGAAPAPSTLDDFKGLIGNWEGPFVAAAFSPPKNGQIVGHVFISNGPTPRMQEIWIV